LVLEHFWRKWQRVIGCQGGGGVTVSGGVPEPCGCGTEDMVMGMVGMGWRLDQVILEVFSNLSISVIQSIWTVLSHVGFEFWVILAVSFLFRLFCDSVKIHLLL